ncbi:NADPH oxidase 4-like isoform X2 [Apostichopus japonicus]|uniref:NADPH oxidase 4-like isoform X2 n=1 Tax=Stichopus japonicus TaxID=307972 RepID=UPI003AB37574
MGSVPEAEPVTISFRPRQLSKQPSLDVTCCRRRNWDYIHIVFLVFWSCVNITVFYVTYQYYKHEAKFFYLRDMLGVSLCLSRGSASVLNLNSAAIFLPMCRTLLVKFRGTKMTKRFIRRGIDRGHFIHVVCASFLLMATVVHVVAHICNAIHFSTNFNEEFSEVNVATFKGENPCKLILTTLAGVSGILMVLLLVMISLLSVPTIRKHSFQLFWYVHHCFPVYYLLLLSHSLGGLLKEQCNVQTHVPGCTMDVGAIPEPVWGKEDMIFTENSTSCIETPKFIPHRSETWCYVLIPILIYLADKVWRNLQSRYPVIVQSVIFHPADVVELEFEKEKFKASPGQYILLMCDKVSHIEWHPFTLTRCPTKCNPTFTIHIRVKGDWTSAVKELLLEQRHRNIEAAATSIPRFFVDGPFGGSSQDVFKYNTSVCIAGGVGITPFAAVLNELRMRASLGNLKLRSLYLIWICRQVDCFQWFAEMITDLYWKLWRENCPDVLNVRLFLTGNSTPNLSTLPKFLLKRVSLGRPEMKTIFQEIAKCQTKCNNIGVFVCGSSKLSTRVYQLCRSCSTKDTKFFFNEDNFA